MSREEMMAALADAGFPVEIVTDDMADEDLEKLVQFVVGGGEGEGDEDETEFADEEDDEDLGGGEEDDEELNFMDDEEFEDGGEEDDEELNFMDDEEFEDEDEDIGKMSGGRPTKVSITKHFNDKGKKVVAFSEAQVKKMINKAVADAVKKSMTRRTQVLKFSEQIDTFLDEQVKAGRVLPSQKQFYRQSLADAAKAGRDGKRGQTALKQRMSEIASGPRILTFSETIPAGGMGGQTPAGLTPEKKAELLAHTEVGKAAVVRMKK